MVEAKKNEHLIIKLQAKTRGFLLRKNNQLMKDMQDPLPKSSNRGNSNRPGKLNMAGYKGRPILKDNCFGQELNEMPNYSNSLTLLVQGRLGEF